MLLFLKDSGENPFLPVMQGMMQSLLSAEVLLPSLKEMLEKYPAWLDENKDKISDADKERYTKQQELFKVICTELEKETPNDSTEVKNERFKIVLKNMQKVWQKLEIESHWTVNNLYLNFSVVKRIRAATSRTYCWPVSRCNSRIRSITNGRPITMLSHVNDWPNSCRGQGACLKRSKNHNFTSRFTFKLKGYSIF